MFFLQKLYKNRRAMWAVFGLDEAKFNELTGRMDALWFGVLASREGRMRAPSAGQGFAFTLRRSVSSPNFFALPPCGFGLFAAPFHKTDDPLP